MEDCSIEIYEELTHLRNQDPTGQQTLYALEMLDDDELEALAAFLSTRIADLSLLPASDSVIFAELEAEDIEADVLSELSFRMNYADFSYEPYPVALGVLSDGTHVPVPLY